MIISHTHKFIFIKTRKTAGTSIQEALATLCGPDDVVTPTGISDESYRPRHFRGVVNPLPYLLHKPRRHRVGRILKRTVQCERIFDHMYLYELLALSESRQWQDYYKFCFERNPWDKTVSRYFWKYRDRDDQPEFEEFVEKDGHVSDFDFYSLNGKIAVDFIGRYENLSDDLHQVSEAIGCEIPLPGFRNANTRKKRDYRDMYTPRSRDKVGEIFAREIKALGFAFD